MNIVWAAQQNFWIIIPSIAILAVLLVRRFFWQKRMATLLDASRKQLVHFSLIRKVLKMTLLVFGLLGLALALARPQWDDSQETVSQEGRDILIMLDISRSMLAQDMKPSRLDAAKRKIKELVNSFKAERVALMIFAGAPFMLCPFTHDSAAFLNFLDSVDVESSSSGATALDKALQGALDAFSSQPTKKHKIVVIFTDGGDFSESVKQMQEKIAQLGLSIFTVGMGTPEGAPIPLFDEQGKPAGHIKDKQGTIVITRLNESQLKQLSVSTGARYIRAADDDSDMQALVTDVLRFEKEKFEDRFFTAKQEKYGIFAAVSLACLLAEWLI